MASNQDKAVIPNAIAICSGLLITALTLLSMIAVGWVQLETYHDHGALKYWYVIAYALCEIWVALGLCLLAALFQRQEWPALFLAVLLWLPAMGVSAEQEHRFHIQRVEHDAKSLAPDRESRRQAEARLAALETELAAIAPQRPIEAIDAELERYGRAPQTYPSKLAMLRSERALSAARTQLLDQQRDAESVMLNTAALPVTTDLSQRSFYDWSLWALVIWMMGVKAGGAWLLTRAAGRPDETTIIHRSEPEALSTLSSTGRPMRLIT